MSIQLRDAAQAQGLPMITTLDDEQYERLDLIVARPVGGGPARLYCLARDWDHTPAGRISQLVYIVESQQQQIELLARRADASDRSRELEQQLAALRDENDDLRAELVARTVHALPPAPSIPRREHAPSAPDAIACPIAQCTRSFATAHALRVHIARSHPDVDAAPPAPPVEETARTHPCPACDRVFATGQALGMHRVRMHGYGTHPRDDDAPFRCAACDSDAFARDLHAPTICIRCARRQAA